MNKHFTKDDVRDLLKRYAVDDYFSNSEDVDDEFEELVDIIWSMCR